MQSKSIDQQSSEKLAKYLSVLDELGIDETLINHHPSKEVLGFFESVTSKGFVADNNQLGQDHINRAIRTYDQGQDIAVTEVKISGDKITDCHGIDETIMGKMTNPDIKSASHVIEMGGHWMALTFKQQTDQSGKPKITAFLADSLPETSANAVETSFDRNRELLQKYLKSFRVDFQRVKVDTQGTEQCGENAVANVLAMQKASYQDLQNYQYVSPSQSQSSAQTNIPSLPVEIAPTRIRRELKSVFNKVAKDELEQKIKQDMALSQPLTPQFSSAVGVAEGPPPMEVRGDYLLYDSESRESRGYSLFDSLRRESLPIREDYPLLGYLERLQTNLALERSLKDAGVEDTNELERLNQERQDLLSNLSNRLENHIDQSSGLGEKEYTNQFLDNLKSPTVANNLEKFLPLITAVVEDPSKINDQDTQLKMQLTIHRIENPSPPRSQLSSHEKLSHALSESHEKLQQNFNLYKNFTLDRGLDGKYAFPEIRLSRIKDQLINYLQIDKQLNSGGNPSLDQQTKEFIDKVFTHEPSKTKDKLPFIIQLVAQPQFVYDDEFKQKYNDSIGYQSIPKPARSSSDVKGYLIGLRSEIFERIKNKGEDSSSTDIQQKFQKLKEGFFDAYRSKLDPMGIRRAERMFSPDNISNKLDFIGELILDPKKANDDELISRYDLFVYDRRGPDVQIRSGGGVGNRLTGSPEESTRNALQNLGDGTHRNQEVGSSEIQFSGRGFGRKPYGSDGGVGLGVSRSEARVFSEEVGSVVDALGGGDSKTPSPSPRPVSCFNFNQFLKSIFGGKSQTTHQGVKSGDLLERGIRRFIGRSKPSGQRSGR